MSTGAATTEATEAAERTGRVDIRAGGGEVGVAWRSGWAEVGAALFGTIVVSVIVACVVGYQRGAMASRWYWAAVAGVAVGWVLTWFARESLHVTGEGFRYVRSWFWPMVDRVVPREEWLGVSGFERGKTKRSAAEYGILIETAGAPVEFGVGMEAAERDAVLEALQRETWMGETRAEIEGPPRRPSDSRIQVARGERSVMFAQRGRWSLKAIEMAYVCAIWNAIVIPLSRAAVNELSGGALVAVLLILLPFQLLGVAFFVMWAGAVVMPALRRTIEFAPGGVEAVWTLAGAPVRRRGVAAREVAAIEGVANPEAKEVAGATLVIANHGYSLRLLDAEERPLLEWHGLTRGEAEWMAAEAIGVYAGRSA